MSTSIHADPDLQELSDGAFRTYFNAIAWSANFEKDGEYRFAGKPPKGLQELVLGGFLVATDHPKTFMIAAYEKWQKSKAELDDVRSKRAEAGRRGGIASGKSRSKPEASASDARSKPEASREPEESRGEEKKLPAPRRRDELFDAVVEVCKINPEELTPTARGPLNRALAELRGVGATPDEVRRRAAAWSFGDEKLTPTGLAKQWPKLGGGAAPGGFGLPKIGADVA